MTAALVPYYESMGVLRRVDGEGDPSGVSLRISELLDLSFDDSEGGRDA